MEAIACENYSFRYASGKEDALTSLTFSISAGELVLLCGRSGSGKSTLLRLLKRQLAPHGESSGVIRIGGKNISELTERESVEKIGYVAQRAEGQLAAESVRRELAFGLESLSLSPRDIRRRCGETAMYFGLQRIYDRNVSTLSGGEKQLLNLASVTVCEPEILLLDEPCSQLDPIAAHSLIDAVLRLHRERGITVIIAEHRSDALFSLCDRILCLENGRLTVNDTPGNAANDPSLFGGALPTAARLHRALGGSGSALTVPEARSFILDNYDIRQRSLPVPDTEITGAPAVKLQEVSFSFARGQYVLRDLSLEIGKGEVCCILGSNGAGKSTLLSLISGVEKPCGGRVTVFGKKAEPGRAALLPQNPRELFLTSKVYDDLMLALPDPDRSEADGRIRDAAARFGLSELLDRHPYDLSGGQQQTAALVKLLLRDPGLLLLDEPTKGMDLDAVNRFSMLLQELRGDGRTILLVTHDTATAALCADRCALLFGGDIISEDAPQRFFSHLAHYTTSEAHISRGIFENAVTIQQIKELCEINSLIPKGGSGHEE